MTVLAALLFAAAIGCWPGRAARLSAMQTAMAGVVGARGEPVSQRRDWRAARGQRRTSRERQDALVHVVAGLESALRAGLAPGAGLIAATEALPTSDAVLRSWLERLAAQARAGQAVGPMWVEMGSELNLPVAEHVGRAWSVSEEVGCAVADAVGAAVAAHQASQRLDRAFAAQTAGPRATTQILMCLPLLGLALMPVLGVSPATAYPPRVLLLCVLPGLALLLAGRALTRGMVARSLRPPEL